MSKMMMRSDRQPPLPKSPVRVLRPSCVLRSTQNIIQSSPASLIKTPSANRSLYLEKMDLRTDHTISCEFQALAKMVRDEFGEPDLNITNSENLYGFVSNTIFERGRFYDEYSARRNERLKRKRSPIEEERENEYVNDLGVRVESAKKIEPKRQEVAKRRVVSTPMRENESQNSRYMLRSMNKKK